MFEGLPREYDVIVVGTGMVESILAAACARIGKSVLHVDTHEYYGSEWTSFTLSGLLEWNELKDEHVIDVKSEDDNEIVISIENPSQVIRNKRLKWNIEKTTNDSIVTAESETPQVTLETLAKQSRKFNVDLAPKLYYSTGGLIDLLVHSNVAKYCEFKLVSRLLFERDGKLENVPSSRADVFNSNEISLIDKRLLMKVIMSFSSMSIEDLQEDREIPFIEYLKKQKLNSTLCHLIINSIAMVDYTATTKEGFIKAKRYLASMGRYGNSPFLYPLYGSGEMTQCFCRLCGVFGGVYFLRFPLAGFTKDRSTEQCTGIASTTGERFRAKDSVICNSSFLSALSDNTQVLHRTVLITNRSIKSSEKEEITYVRLSDTNESGIHVIEVGNGSNCTPDGFFLLYIFQEQPQEQSMVENSDLMLERLLKLTGDHFTRANILGELTFDQVKTVSSTPMPKLIATHGPDGSIDHDSAVESARTIFHQMYPNGEEFLPRAPDPEDIIFEDTSNTGETSTVPRNNDSEASS